MAIVGSEKTNSSRKYGVPVTVNRPATVSADPDFKSWTAASRSTGGMAFVIGEEEQRKQRLADRSDAVAEGETTKYQ